MDPVRNPYQPGAGLRPAALVGRDEQLAGWDIAVTRIEDGRNAQPVVFYGLRGVGKTVLLSSTLVGNNTCVRRQPRHLPRRGRSRPAPRTSRRRAQPHGLSTHAQPGTGQPTRPARRSSSTAAAFSPTVITRCTPMHQDGPSVSAKTCGRAVAYLTTSSP